MNENLHQLKENFLQEWPLRRIQNMTLEEYTNLEKTSFCYWVEAITTDVGSIWGGSAYKFGIFKRLNLESTTSKDSLITDGEYSWAKKYGTTKEIAFQKIKTILLAIIENTQNNTIEQIDEIDLGDAYKWKIAFLYGDFNIINIFKNESLVEAANSLGYTGTSKKFTDLYRFMLPLKQPEQDFFDFTKELWQQTTLANATKYWIYAPGSNANKWEEFYNEGIMGLGWDELGDLDQYNSKKEIKKRLQEIEGVETTKQNDTAANFEFHKEIKEGDYIFVKKGIHELLGYGIVTSDYYYDEDKVTYQKCRKVDWKLKGNWKLEFNLPLKTLTDITKFPTGNPNYSKYYEQLLAILEGETYNKNYKIEYNKWFKLKLPSDSGTLNSYNKSIEILNTKLDYNIYENNDLFTLNALYEELKTVQKTEGNKYWDSHTPSYGKKGFYSAAIKSYIDFHNELKTYAMSNSSKKVSLNTILYGPPGTGKTYNSINKAIEIINPTFDLTQDRKIVKDEFDRLVADNQILFTTFHQSMSYEDFIEGIKPETKDKNVIYDVVPGLFLEICTTAENNWEDAKEGNSKKLSFEEAFLLLKEEWFENEEIKFPLKREGNDFTIIGFTKKSIQFKKASGGTGHTLSIGTLKDYYYKKKEIKSTGVGIYYPSILDKLSKYQPIIISEKVVKNHVIIIDEINRGNVSQIFGELITLIEDSKRLGNDEALEVILPYSKEKFGVPPNLYIIGTMNTADRSVEALDTALRRRFSFVEMMPDDKVISEKKFTDYDRAKIMNVINQRIEVLLDRNYTLGHSYFIKEDFKNSFENEIIPLLQEYFYNDYGKIGLVLGKGFVREKAITAKNDKSIFADFDTKNEVDITKSYELIPFTEIDFEVAIQTLLA